MTPSPTHAQQAPAAQAVSAPAVPTPAVPTPDSEPTLVVENLAVELGGRLVLQDAGLTVARGELVGLLGPNGAGKTTLLRTVLGLLRPAAGRVTVAGRVAKPGRTAIGYVPQRHEFAWEFPASVADVVGTGLTGRLGLFRRMRTEHWEAVAEALDRVRMTEFATRPVGQLSGGQRQRVLVARALVLRPSLLLLDEPFTGLDLITQDLLSQLFAGLAHEGHAVLMTTHDLVGALDACDRVALLNRTVIAAGTPAALADDPSVWMAAFGVGPDSALLRVLKAAA
ncbi:MAG: anchored repeat-type ABC transporter ATP-binding subunit [Propioniciclava sp.]|uniref:anchored repeat-type ABC transporter ATP-binding subunit n=1 Tax=Propioniciclava sp. TaxID=2038686 RepID=UPI0039E33A89